MKGVQGKHTPLSRGHGVQQVPIGSSEVGPLRKKKFGLFLQFMANCFSANCNLIPV